VQVENDNTPTAEDDFLNAAEEVLDEDLEQDGQEGDDELDELELGYEKFRVAKPLKAAVEKWRASTTQKEQSLAEERKAFEAYAAEQAKIPQERIEAAADYRNAVRNVEALQAKIQQQREERDIAGLADSMSLLDEWRAYGRKAQERVQDLDQKLKAEVETATNQRAAKAAEQLEKDIPGWSSGVAKQVFEYALQNGWTQDELSEVRDARTGKLLHREWLASQVAQKPQQQQPQAAAKAPIKPLTTVSKGKPAATRGLSDDLPMEEWAKRERLQKSNRARR
jgi:hypothetical protein